MSRKQLSIFSILLLVLLAAGVYAVSSMKNPASMQPAETDGTKTTEKSVEAVVDKEATEAASTREPVASPAVPEPEPFVICIDPGHQERANLEQEPIGPGASETKIKVSGGTEGAVTGKPEYELALEASVLLGELLTEQGFQVMFIRTAHNVDISNRERAEIANQNNADLFIRMHADGSTDANVRGFSVLTPSDDNPYTTAIYDDSLLVSQLIVEEVKKNEAVHVKGIMYRNDIAGFNWSKVPVTLVEMGYMSNPVEDRNLADPTYLRELLQGVTNGIVQYAEAKRSM